MAGVAWRNSLRTRVLSALAGTAWIAGDLWDEIYGHVTDPSRPAPMHRYPSRGYGPVFTAHQRKFAARAASRNEQLRSRLRYYQTITALVCDGFVEKRGRGERATLQLTRRGITEAHARTKRPQVPDPTSYEASTDRAVTIVSYDIPERDRWKRAWIRAVLVHNEYHKLHQSVWLGTKPLPERFLRDARTLRVLHHLEIFEVGKEGTLKDRVEHAR